MLLAWRNLQQHRLRTALSALAVALGVAMIVSPGMVRSSVQGGWSGGENAMSWITDMIAVVFSSISAVMFAAAGFFVLNAFAMAVTQQRRQIGALRSLGLTRRQVLRLVLIEALVTSALGVALGLAAGPLLGRVILATMERMGVPTGAGHISAIAWLTAVGVGLVVAPLAALLPARRAARIAPLAALRDLPVAGETASWPRLTRAGLLLGGGLLAYLLIAPPGAWSGAHPPWQWIMVALLEVAWLAAWGCLAPSMMVVLARALRYLLLCWGSATGRLAADNLLRAPQRTVFSVLTFAVSATSIVGTGGLLAYNNDVLLGRLTDNILGQTLWNVYPFDRTTGIAQLGAFSVDSLGLDEAVIADVYELAAGQVEVGESYIVNVPEISSPLPGFPSFMVDAAALENTAYTFYEGDWASARPLLEQGCGLLIPPAVAGQWAVGAGDTLVISGASGPVECVVAGVVSGGFVPTSMIGLGARDDFAPGRLPDSLVLLPLPGVDAAALAADLTALEARYPGEAFVSLPEDEIEAVMRTSDQLQGIVNGLLLLVVVAAAVGMINTTVMSVAERQRELTLLRAVGATRQQVLAIVVGEAALVGLIGALLGVLGGVGMGVVYGLAFGGIPFGLVDLPLWPAALETIPPALRDGLPSFVAAPLLAAGAAYVAVMRQTAGVKRET